MVDAKKFIDDLEKLCDGCGRFKESTEKACHICKMDLCSECQSKQIAHWCLVPGERE